MPAALGPVESAMRLPASRLGDGRARFSTVIRLGPGRHRFASRGCGPSAQTHRDCLAASCRGRGGCAARAVLPDHVRRVLHATEMEPPRYSPMIPSDTIWAPENSASIDATEVKPATVVVPRTYIHSTTPRRIRPSTPHRQPEERHDSQRGRAVPGNHVEGVTHQGTEGVVRAALLPERHLYGHALHPCGRPRQQHVHDS